MSLANMRQNGVRAVIATCESCNRSADVNVDALLEKRDGLEEQIDKLKYEKAAMPAD